jgi:hypothetical protein
MESPSHTDFMEEALISSVSALLSARTTLEDSLPSEQLEERNVVRAE